jgi:hypothetical protein
MLLKCDACGSRVDTEKRWPDSAPSHDENEKWRTTTFFFLRCPGCPRSLVAVFEESGEGPTAASAARFD